MVPGAETSGVVGRHGDAWKIRVGAAPERGRANAAALRLISEALDVDFAAVRFVGGRAARDKVVEVFGLDAAEAERRLAR